MKPFLCILDIIVTFLRISVTGANDTISVSFTSYTNLGSMMSDNNTGAVIRSDIC